jgi:integrase
MYTEGQNKAKVGIVSVDIHRNSYRLRFVYPEKTRHQFTVSKVSNEGWVTAIKAAQLINRDIDLGDFDETYARYSPKHARKLAVAKEEKTKQYNLKELWEIYKESNKDRVAKTTQNNSWKQFDNFLVNIDSKTYQLDKAHDFTKEAIAKYAVTTVASTFRTCLHPAINQAIKKKLIISNPYKDIELPKVQKKAPECFEPDEVKAIIEAFSSNAYCSKYSRYEHNDFRRRAYSTVIKGLVKDGKVHKYLKPYCLRHSFITRLVREGVDIATIAALSGNSTEVILDSYLASRKEFDLPEL